jgi:hypothetical protein
MVDCMAGLDELASATVISVVDEADHGGAKALVSKTIDIKTAVVVVIIFIVVSPILNPELDTLWTLNVFAEAGIHESVGKVPRPWGVRIVSKRWGASIREASRARGVVHHQLRRSHLPSDPADISRHSSL